MILVRAPLAYLCFGIGCLFYSLSQLFDVTYQKFMLLSVEFQGNNYSRWHGPWDKVLTGDEIDEYLAKLESEDNKL